MMIETRTYIEPAISVMERINQKETVYICYDDDNRILFGTPSETQAQKYCRINNCSYSTYPVKTFTNQYNPKK